MENLFINIVIPKLETFDERAHGMSTDNKSQLVLFYTTGLPTENVPRELTTCYRERFMIMVGLSI